ncbi:hypothetical protein B484DRAFT_479110, partial [Ochromonadaceae sp. CCMP2298]
MRVLLLCITLQQVYSRGVFGGLQHVFRGGSKVAEEGADEEKIVHRKVVIIGSGPAGLTAAIYTSRAMLEPLQVAGYSPGGQLMLTSDVENFPGYRGAVTGPELIDDLSTQAKKFGAEVWQTDVTAVDFSQRPFKLTLPNCTVTADAVILSTGANAIWLGADREEEFMGKGISTCATCDGFLFREQSVVVVGGGDSAMEEASFLTRFAKDVTIVHRRDTFRASKIMLDRAQNNPKIKFVLNAQIKHWRGENGVLSGVTYVDTLSGEESQVRVQYAQCLSAALIQKINVQSLQSLRCSNVPLRYQLDCKGAFIAIGHK